VNRCSGGFRSAPYGREGDRTGGHDSEEVRDMRLTLHAFLTIDGVVQGPAGADEDTTDGFERGGWLVPYVDEEFGDIVSGWFRHADAILLGRTTYDEMFPYWSQVDDPDNPAAVKLNGRPKYVASRTLTDPQWQHTTVLDGDVLAHVRALKKQAGEELQVHGSCLLARDLHAAGLIDEYRLLVLPVVVGQGKRLFTDGMPASGFTVTESRTTAAGATYTALTPTPFRTGSMFDGQEG
jgi:dihydrofolate reductase